MISNQAFDCQVNWLYFLFLQYNLKFISMLCELHVERRIHIYLTATQKLGFDSYTTEWVIFRSFFFY